MNTVKRKYISEFIGLDLLRFCLSVAVVMRHYYHLYGPFRGGPYKSDQSVIPEQPFYSVLSGLYNNGHYAVQAFWMISGLIFFSIYHEDVVNRKISFRRFSFLRFTRLYPLHFLTLLIVAVLQLQFFRTYHYYYFEDQFYDLKHFVAQLLFMSNWFPTMHHSFNMPIWSVSIEIFVYVGFYVLAAAGLSRGKGLVAIILASFIFHCYGFLAPFNECMLYFFSGCLLVRFIQSDVPLKRILIYAIIISIGSIIFVKTVRYFFGHDGGIFNEGILLTLRLLPLTATLILVFILAFRAVTSKRIISTFRNLGNMTYSIYLVHFPVQIIIYLVLRPSSYLIFDDPKMLFLFLISNILVGWVAFEYFEKPVQKYLRYRFERKTSSQESVLPQQSPRLEQIKT